MNAGLDILDLSSSLLSYRVILKNKRGSYADFIILTSCPFTPAHPELCPIGSIRPLCVLLQGYSAAGSTFYVPSSDDETLEVGQEDPRTFPQRAGISIPSLETLARSFLRSYFALLRKRNAAKTALKEASPEVPLPPVPRTLSILRVWISYVKLYGYHPLGEIAMRIGGSLAPGIDEEMATYWERGF